jgi:hypothetical protein
VAFAEPARVVLARHGLVLAEGPPVAHLSACAGAIGSSFGHLRVWADSPALATDIGRDHVVRDAGRKLIEGRVVDLVERLRDRLVDAIEAVARAPSWSAAQHERYGQLHAHLAYERTALGESIDQRALFRCVDGSAIAMRALAEHAQWSVIARIDPDGQPFEAFQDAGVPTLVATDEDARTWLDPWLAERGIASARATRLLRAVTPSARPAPFVSMLSELMRRAGFATIVRSGSFAGAMDRCWGIEVDGGVLVSPARPRERERTTLWIDERHQLFVAAITRSENDPLLAAAAVLFTVAAESGADLEDVVATIDEYAEERGWRL